MGFLDFWDNLIDGNEGNSSGNIIGGRQKLVNDLTGSHTTSNTLGSTTSTGSVVPQPGVTNNPYADIGNSSNAGGVNNTSDITNRKAATGSNNATASGGEKQTSYIYNNNQVIPEVPTWTPSKSNLINPWENLNKNGASQITWPGGEEKAAEERNRDELEKISSQHLAEERAYNEAKAEEEKDRRQRENTFSAHLAEERAYNEAKVEEERAAQINELASTISDMVPETEEEEIRKNQYMQELLIGTFNNDYQLINDLEERVSNDLTEKDLNSGLAEFNQLIEDNESLSYIYDSGKQLVGGNYYEGDPTLLGTAAQVALGLTGLDFAADIRDLTHDLTNWEWTPQHIGGTLLDAIGLLPVFGSLKFADELGAVAKNGIKSLDEVSDTMKATDKALDGAEDIAKAGKNALDEVAGKVPKSASLSDLDARKWYLEQESKIPEMIDKTKPLEQQARHAFELRNQFRSQARDAMSNRSVAEKLNLTDQNQTWEQIVTKYVRKGFTGDDLYEEIIKASTRSRAIINESLGIYPK